jgi:urea transport system substrate-binding protein
MRRGFWIGAILLVALVAIAGTIFAVAEADKPPIKVGILHSRTGAMKISEESMVEAEQLALDEINARGGLLGRRVVGVVADGRSDWPTFAQEAQRLISDEKVSVIVGCWTSASRKSVKPVVEQANHLLIYPMAYEGLELSPNIVYTGGSANQQVLPALRWANDTLKAKTYFLVGSDYVWPHCVNEIIKDALQGLEGKPIDEQYVPFGSSDVADLVARIKKAQPDVVLSTIAGETNLAFYARLRQEIGGAKAIPVISFSIAENELRAIPPRDVEGHYSAWNYFQSLDRPENLEFVQKFRAKYGADRVTNDVMVAAYNSVKLWAQAVEEAGTDDVATIIKFLRRQSIDAPEGVISIDPETQHTYRPFYLGKARPDGQFDVVWSLQKPIRPAPYPITRSPGEWDDFLERLHTEWQGNWANPNTTRAAPAG